LPVGVMDTAVGAEPELWWLMTAMLLAVVVYRLRLTIGPIRRYLEWAK